MVTDYNQLDTSHEWKLQTTGKVSNMNKYSVQNDKMKSVTARALYIVTDWDRK